MANKTRENIISEVYEYIPQMEVTGRDDLLDNIIDLAAEMISQRHNFSYLRATSPATHDVTADEYYIAEADFSFTNFKEILFFQWIKAATGENARIIFLPFPDFIERYPYVECSGNTDGKPKHYTKAGTRYLFNCQLDETVTMRAWYQQLHGNFANDAAFHAFTPDNLGFQAIVSIVLSELHDALPALEVSPKAAMAMQKSEIWIDRLIRADLIKSDQPIEFEWGEKRTGEAGITNPYEWV